LVHGSGQLCSEFETYLLVRTSIHKIFGKNVRQAGAGSQQQLRHYYQNFSPVEDGL
jgi:hypothetical protein